ncbi:TonB-dependent receptor [Alteromonas sp. 1_MG-2023]|uniref:TonB-dependent siderophore receptor n=1 Tax=Alteromonas sp. 1_MG-2023 TaxID=3062669 RepID=UPI0026E38FC3|nr:TonB-dependent receptor plug domain-containing protein [Alteromonas sp. 1_MG-2023]MDO6568591.1 TonB-dependent receptor [Alteromonas sp. 1_MG-2023]
MKTLPFSLGNLAKGISYGLLLSASSQTFAADTDKDSEDDIEKIEVQGSLGSLPGQDVQAIFGFGKSILETPRSASTISYEQMERFDISDIDDLVAFAPGTFTQSFFGVAGSLDVRGTPGESYFRGVKRLDNPGNYPTPIGASSRIDVVRGPASPIYGPAKVGGYLNFEPKSARSSQGQYMDQDSGELSYTRGSWDKNILTAEVGGPTTIAGKDAGFYGYAEIENSGSYYDNTSTQQTILQTSFNVDINKSLRFEFGGMYQDYDGNQVAGWNRLTQELIDSGTYITGTAQPLDTDGNGSISQEEFNAEGLGGGYYVVDPSSLEASDLSSAYALENVGTAQLSRSSVLVAEDDQLANEAITLYFDTIYYTDNGWEIKNQMFYDGYDNLNENSYGFSQLHDSWTAENKLVFSAMFDTDSMEMAVQISPSIRYTNFEHGEDYSYEFFDRRDLTMESTALDRVELSTRTGEDYTNYYKGNYIDYGLAALGDFTWDMGLNLVLGLRYDSIDMESRQVLDKLEDPDSVDYAEASGTDGGISWTASVSYKTPIGLIPYATAARQTTVIAGQGAEITTTNIAEGTATAASKMHEFGIKGSFLDDSLYVAVDYYEQERTDYSAQNTTTNNTTRAEGYEAELRWVVNEQLVITGGYTNTEVTNLSALGVGQYGRLGADDLANIEGYQMYGGYLAATTGAESNLDALKAGMPENIYTLTATYDFQNGLAANVNVVDVDETYSGFTQTVKLPAYTLVGAGIVYTQDAWKFSLNVKNLTNEKYFRANFPDFAGGDVVLPELPRNWTAKVSYKF